MVEYITADQTVYVNERWFTKPGTFFTFFVLKVIKVLLLFFYFFTFITFFTFFTAETHKIIQKYMGM